MQASTPKWGTKVRHLRKHMGGAHAVRTSAVVLAACFARSDGANLRTMEREHAERLAANIKTTREQHQISVRRAADSTEGLVSASTWARLEDPDALEGTRIGRNKLIGVAYALGVDPAQVFEWAGMEYVRLPSDPAPFFGHPGLPDEDEEDAGRDTPADLDQQTAGHLGRYHQLDPEDREVVDDLMDRLLRRRN